MDQLSHLPAAYDSFQMILIDGVTLAGVDPQIIHALHRWVERGGTLVAFPGKSWSGGVSDALLQLLSVSQGNPNAVAPADLVAVAGIQGREKIYRELFPVSGAQSIQGGLAMKTQRGTGSITTFTLGPIGSSFPDPDRAAGIYDVLSRSVERSLSFWGMPGNGLSRIESNVLTALSSMSNFHIPPQWAVALGLLIYIVLGFLVPNHIFKIWSRREWTFLVVILAAVLATVGIYGFGVLTGQENLEMAEVSILRVHRQGTQAETTSFISLISPKFERVRFEAEEADAKVLEDALIQPWRPGQNSNSYYSRQNALHLPGLVIESDVNGRLNMPLITLFPNGMRLFRYDYNLPLKDIIGIEYRSAEEGHGEQVRFKNLSSVPMRRFLLVDGKWAQSGEIKPAQEWTLNSGSEVQLKAGKKILIIMVEVGIIESPYAMNSKESLNFPIYQRISSITNTGILWAS